MPFPDDKGLSPRLLFALGHRELRQRKRCQRGIGEHLVLGALGNLQKGYWCGRNWFERIVSILDFGQEPYLAVSLCLIRSTPSLPSFEGLILSAS